MTDFLEQVVASRRAYVRAAKARRSEDELLRDMPLNAWARGPVSWPAGRLGGGPEADAFERVLRHRKRNGHLAVIAEVKRVSPALGRLAPQGASAAVQAMAYEAAGAAAISVLVEPEFWGGSLEDLAAVRAAVSLPLLCKDVIVDEYQIAEARAAGADAVLLIAEVLSDAELQRFHRRAAELQMGALVEAHESVAFGRAVACGSPLVGINARNLRLPSDIDIGRARQLHTFAKPGQIVVAESGIASVDDARLLPARVDAVLVGTALMRGDPGALLTGLAGIRKAVSV